LTWLPSSVFPLPGLGSGSPPVADRPASPHYSLEPAPSGPIPHNLRPPTGTTAPPKAALLSRLCYSSSLEPTCCSFLPGTMYHCSQVGSTLLSASLGQFLALFTKQFPLFRLPVCPLRFTVTFWGSVRHLGHAIGASCPVFASDKPHFGSFTKQIAHFLPPVCPQHFTVTGCVSVINLGHHCGLTPKASQGSNPDRERSLASG
jgi:hypothetical protein